MTMMSMFIISSWESTCKKPRMEWVMGLGGWEVDGVLLSIFYLLLSFLVQAASGGVRDCPGVRGMETQEYPEWTVEGIN